jgi:hypothetical protein
MTNKVKQPDPEKHLFFSLLKSGVRIFSSIVSVIAMLYGTPFAMTFALAILAVGYGAAEVVGIVEELV